MHKLVVPLVLAAACGGATPSGPTANTGGAGGATPVYAALFEQGKRWTFPVTLTTTPPIDLGPAIAEDRGELTCQVASAHAMGAVQMAEVACTYAGDDSGTFANVAPGGHWVATADGLWHFGGLSADEVHAKVAALDPRAMLIAATPAARSSEVGSVDDGDGLSVYWAKPGAGGAWCTGYTFALGDEAGWQLCLDAAAGVVSGSWFSAGATTTEFSYGAAQ